MSTIYSRAQIEAFSQKRLEVQGINPEAEIRVRKDFADTVQTMAPWMQAILIESGFANVVKPLEKVDEEFKGAAGYFSPLLPSKPIVWSHDTENLPAEIIVRHEEGHRLDNILAAKIDDGKGWYFSDKDEQWKSALQKELQTPGMNNARTARIPGIKDIAHIFKRSTQADAPIYEGYRTLKQHLSNELYKDPVTHPREAMAEMYNHHATLFAKTSGNEKTVDRILSRHYPHLWPVYRDTVIPLAQEHAKALLGKREEWIEAYVAGSHALHDLQGKTFDADTARDTAVKALINRTIETDINEMSALRNLFRNPIEKYVQACEALIEERADILGTTFKFEEDVLWDKATEMRDDQGVPALVAETQRIVQERKALEKFVGRKTDYALDLREVESTRQIDMAALLRQFDTLYAEGGAERVKHETDLIPKRADIERYFSLREDQYQARQTILLKSTQIPDEFTRFLADEIRDIVKVGGPELLQKEILDVREETRTMEAYERAVLKVVGAISSGNGINFEADPTQILSDFDNMMQRGGMEAVQAQISRLSVSATEIRDYLRAGESLTALKQEIEKIDQDEPISWGRKDGQYRYNGDGMPLSFLNDLNHKAMDVMQKHGAAELKKRTAVMQIQIHEIVGNRIGKPAPVPESLLLAAGLEPVRIAEPARKAPPRMDLM